MMAKKDNFDFDTDSKAKLSFDFGFLKGLTKKQKELILMIAIAVVLVIVIIGVVVLNGNSGDKDGGIGGIFNGGEDGSNDDNNGEIPEEITEFYISDRPNKTVYYVGDAPNYSGMTFFVKSGGTVSISYDDHPDEFTITGFDSSAPAEEQVITVECRGFTDTFTIKILEKDIGTARLVGITIDPLPQTTYKVGESFNTTGGYIVCEYSDGTYKTEAITMKNIFGFGAIAYTPGEHQIKIKYSDDKGGYAETYITITIVEE